MFFLFMPADHIHAAMARDLGNAAETNIMELHKHKAHASLLLAEKLSRGQSAINIQRSTFNIETYCMIVSVVKYKEIFQVYIIIINNYYKVEQCNVDMYSCCIWLFFYDCY